MTNEKLNYLLCSEIKDILEFSTDHGGNYDKFMNWQRHHLCSEKFSKRQSSLNNSRLSKYKN